MIHYIVRPKSFRSLAKALREPLSAERILRCDTTVRDSRTYTAWRDQRPIIFDYTKDFLIGIPHPDRIINTPSPYIELHYFYTLNKRDQRLFLGHCNVKTPDTHESDTFIIRPLNHFGGRDYRISLDDEDYNNETHYISNAFHKTHEYRLIVVLGKPLILLAKKPGEHSGPYDPWNHQSGAYFATRHSFDTTLLSRTSFFTDIERIPFLSSTHIVAIDVLYGPAGYAVTELNFAPSITIPANVARIAQHVRDSHSIP